MMSSAATAPASPAKSPKKRARSQRKKAGPTLSDLILRAAGASTERGGVSLAALKKALGAAGYDAVRNKARVVGAVKRLVANKSLVQTKGTGASGSFRLSKKPPAPRGRKKKAARKKKPGTRGAKRGASAKTAAAGATPAVKRSPKKRKSPKKAKRPAGAKRARKAKSPKKAKRRVSASTGTRTRTRARARAAAKK